MKHYCVLLSIEAEVVVEGDDFETAAGIVRKMSERNVSVTVRDAPVVDVETVTVEFWGDSEDSAAKSQT